MFKNNNKDTIGVFIPGIFIVNFEHIIAGWNGANQKQKPCLVNVKYYQSWSTELSLMIILSLRLSGPTLNSSSSKMMQCSVVQKTIKQTKTGYSVFSQHQLALEFCDMSSKTFDSKMNDLSSLLLFILLSFFLSFSFLL